MHTLGSDRKKIYIDKILGRITQFLFVLFCIITILIMIIVGAIGIWSILAGILTFLFAEGNYGFISLIGSFLHGVELMLAAPIPFAIVIVGYRYIVRLLPLRNDSLESRRTSDLGDIKIFILGLLAGILATEIVLTVLEREIVTMESGLMKGLLLICISFATILLRDKRVH